jgi:parvulin-like peptidyl-prolyl isomerase
MSDRSNKTPKDKEKSAEVKLSRTQIKQRQLRIFLLSLLCLAVLIVGGTILYQQYLAPYRKVVLNVENTVVRMDYFLKRARMNGNDITSTIQQLTFEQIVKLEAKEIGITISNLDIDKTLLSAAASENVTASSLSDKAFREWYSAELKSTDLSSTEYREMTRTLLTGNEIQAVIAQNIPDKLEQVHLHIIVLSSPADADKVRARLNSGEDFANVASQVSIDTQTAQYGGDLGWVPEGIFYAYDDVIFKLEIGQVSETVTSTSGSQYLLFMVSEKDPERSIDTNVRQQLAYYSFQSWLYQLIEQYTIEVNLDEETLAWVEWQLAKVNH